MMSLKHPQQNEHTMYSKNFSFTIFSIIILVFIFHFNDVIAMTSEYEKEPQEDSNDISKKNELAIHEALARVFKLFDEDTQEREGKRNEQEAHPQSVTSTKNSHLTASSFENVRSLKQLASPTAFAQINITEEAPPPTDIHSTLYSSVETEANKTTKTSDFLNESASNSDLRRRRKQPTETSSNL